jgi:hypothetical protein
VHNEITSTQKCSLMSAILIHINMEMHWANYIKLSSTLPIRTDPLCNNVNSKHCSQLHLAVCCNCSAIQQTLLSALFNGLDWIRKTVEAVQQNLLNMQQHTCGSSSRARSEAMLARSQLLGMYLICAITRSLPIQ